MSLTRKKILGYLRVSTPDQVAEGVSLETQRSRIEAWCTASDFELIDVLVDSGISGGRADNRPGLQAAIDLACSKRAALIVYSLSRLARSTSDILSIAARLERCGADLISVSEQLDTTSASGKMVFRLLAVLSEFERDLVIERTTATMAHLRRQNRRISRHLPFGQKLDAEHAILIPCPREQKTLTFMKDLRRSGQGYNAIARTLNQQGIPSKTGTLWSATAVRGILLRSDNFG